MQSLTVTRAATLGEFLSCCNLRVAQSLQNALASLPAGAVSEVFSSIYGDLEQATSIDNLNARVRQLTPHAVVRAPAIALRRSDALSASLSANLRSVPERLHTWVNPIYSQSSRLTARNCAFDSGKEKYGGVIVGIGRMVGDSVALAGEFGYLYGKYDTSGSREQSDSFGIMLGTRVGQLQNTGAYFNPWLEMQIGGVYGNASQKRRDYFGGWQRSSPDTALFRTGLHVGNDFQWGENALLTPRIGADFAFVKRDSYREQGTAPLRLNVSGQTFRSFRPAIGLDVAVRATPRLTINGQAHFRYETAGKLSTLRTEYIVAPSFAFVTCNDNRSRASATLGGSMRYQATERASLGAGYDLVLEHGYVGHRISGSVAVDF